MLIIPSQIIEISITPNSFSILLMLIILILCFEPIEMIKRKELNRIIKGVIFLVFTVLVITHPINGFILILMILIFFIFEKISKNYKLIISINEILSLISIWVFWLIFLTFSGKSLVKAISKMISNNSFGFENGIQYSMGNTGFVYPFIEQLSVIKYSLYGVFALFIVLYIIIFYRSNIKNPIIISSLPFLIISALLIILTFFNLIRGGSDIHNIISRTMNFAMFSLCTFIAFFIPLLIKSKIKVTKLMELFFIILLSFSLLTYPIYSFARDAYINYPQSEEKGRLFSKEFFIDEKSSKIEISKSNIYYLYMNGKISFKDMVDDKIKISKYNKYYSNNWYTIEGGT